MAETKHTLGPWHLRPDRPLKKGGLEQHEIISDNGLSIALPIGGLHDEKEKLANARLIASAPTLQAKIDRLEASLDVRKRICRDVVAEKVELVKILQRLDIWDKACPTISKPCKPPSMGSILEDTRALLAKHEPK